MLRRQGYGPARDVGIHRITGPRYNLHPSTEAHLGSSPASIAKAIYPVAHLSAQANAYHVTNRHGCLRQGHVSSNGIASPASSGIANPRTYRPRARRLRFKDGPLLRGHGSSYRGLRYVWPRTVRDPDPPVWSGGPAFKVFKVS